MRRTTGRGTAGPEPVARAFVRRLGEAGYGPGEGQVGTLDLLARSGLPVPEGFVLTAEGHREFLRAGSRAFGEALEREIRAALLDLGARTVVVGWAYGKRRGLGTIPAVVSAVRGAWSSAKAPGGRRIPVRAGAEIATWPVLVQRQVRPEYTGWTTTADLRPGHAARVDLPLHDVEPASGRGHEGIPLLTRRAAGALESTVRLGWGLENGRWLLVSVEQGPYQRT